MSSNQGSNALVLLILAVVIDLGGRAPPRVDFDANGDAADDADDVLDADGGSGDTSSESDDNG